MLRDLKYVGVNNSTIWVVVNVADKYKIPESVIRKALMIAMNYIMENMETEDKESVE